MGKSVGNAGRAGSPRRGPCCCRRPPPQTAGAGAGPGRRPCAASSPVATALRRWALCPSSAKRRAPAGCAATSRKTAPAPWTQRDCSKGHTLRRATHTTVTAVLVPPAGVCEGPLREGLLSSPVQLASSNRQERPNRACIPGSRYTYENEACLRPSPCQ